jgi:hypothetical protein
VNRALEPERQRAGHRVRACQSLPVAAISTQELVIRRMLGEECRLSTKPSRVESRKRPG